MKLTVDLRKPALSPAISQVEIVSLSGAIVLANPEHIKAVRLMRNAGMSRMDTMRAVKALTRCDLHTCKTLLDAEPHIVF